MSVINTKRLVLRGINEQDVDDIYEYACSPDVGPNAGWKPHENKEESMEVMKAIFLDQDGIWGIVESDKLIGSVGLIKDPKRENDNVRMLGYALSDKHWGKGIMTEAVKAVLRYGFDELDLDLISAYCYPFNDRSKNVLKKCGFCYEGTLKLAEKIYNGNVYDNDCYALTAQEFDEVR